MSESVQGSAQLSGSETPRRFGHVPKERHPNITRALTLEGRAGVSVRRAGIYAARDARGTTLRVIGVTHDPAGSSTRALPRERLESWLSPLGVLEAEQAGEVNGAPRATADPTPPWSMLLLALALGVACVELAMARFFSHAHADDRAKETTP